MTCREPNEGTLLHYLKNRYSSKRLDLSPKAEEQIAVSIRRLDAYAKRQVQLSELSKELLTKWLKELSNAGQAAATINSKRGAIMAIWNAAHNDGLAPAPPRRHEVPSKRVPRRLPNSWTIPQMMDILDACRMLSGTFRHSGIRKADFMTSLILFDYDTGTRLAASLEVLTQDLDLRTGGVYLRWESAKTGVEQYHVLSVETLDAIKVIWDPRRKHVWPWGPTKHLLWDTLRDVLQRVGLPSDRRSMFHRFRRTTATVLTGRVGISAATAALGHTSEAMTRKYVDPTNLPNVIRPIDHLPRLRASG